MATFAEAAIKIVADGSALNTQLQGIQRMVADTGRQMAQAASVAVVGVTAAMGALGATFAVMTKQSANAGDDLAKLSQRIGIAVETLSGYSVAASLSGTSLQDFGTSLQMASRNIVEAAQGSGAAKDAFDALGISATDSTGKIKSAEAIMLEVADRFAGMEDGAQKTAFAMDIFGRSGASMIPLLNQGSEAIREQREEAQQLGATWTTAQAKMAEEFNDNLERIQTALGGFRNAVVSNILPFLNKIVESIVESIKQLGASGDLQKWAKASSDFIIDAFLAAANGMQQLLLVIPKIVDGFRLLMTVVRGFEALFEVAIGGILKGVGWLIGALARAAEFLGLDMAKGLRAAQQSVEEWGETATLAGVQALQASHAWQEAMGSSDATADKIGSALSAATLKLQAWAAAAKSGTTDAVDAIGKANTKAAQTVVQSIKEQLKAFDEEFKALKTMGEVSLQETVNYLRKRIEFFKQGTSERKQAEAEAFKAAQEMTDKYFTHEEAMGKKSLQDAINFYQQKAAAAKEGSEAQMKAEEAAYKKEEELRNKRNNAALGILGEVKERMEAKGLSTDYVTKADVEREMAELQAERGQKALGAQQFGAGSGMSLADVIAGYQAAGKLNASQGQTQQLGGVGDILAGGAKVATGPLTEQLGAIGDALTNPITPAFAEAWKSAYETTDAWLTRITGRVDQGTAQIWQSLERNLEQWFVRTLTAQAERS